MLTKTTFAQAQLDLRVQPPITAAPKIFHHLISMAMQSIKNQNSHSTCDVLMTSEDARWLVENVNYTENRRLNKVNMAVLKNAMGQSKFREFTDIHFAYVKQNHSIHLINGQHTLSAVGQSAPQYLCTHVYVLETEESLEPMYSTFDIGRPRNLVESSQGFPEEVGLHKDEANSLLRAARSIKLKFRTNHGLDIERKILNKDFEGAKELARNWADEAVMYFDAMKFATKHNKSIFLRYDIVAVGLITFRSAPEQALQFWRGAAEDDGLRRGDPRKALVNWLIQHPTETTPHQEQHRAAITCWNAYVEGRELLRSPQTSSAKSLSINLCDFKCVS